MSRRKRNICFVLGAIVGVFLVILLLEILLPGPLFGMAPEWMCGGC